MTIGTKFLERVLTEAKKEKAGYAFDAGTEGLKRKLRTVGGQLDIADKVAEVAAMLGVPGIVLNKNEVRDSVIDAAQALRTKTARLTAFLALHSALGAFHGVAPSMKKEAKEVKEPSEEDLQGSQFLKRIEEILMSLGIPGALISTEAKPGTKSGLRRVSTALMSDDAVKTALITYAARAGIKVGDKELGSKPDARAKKAKADMFAEAEEADAAAADDGKPELSANKYVELAYDVAKTLGIPFDDARVLRVVNQNGLKSSILAALTGNAQLKTALTNFARTAKMK